MGIFDRSTGWKNMSTLVLVFDNLCAAGPLIIQITGVRFARRGLFWVACRRTSNIVQCVQIRLGDRLNELAVLLSPLLDAVTTFVGTTPPLRYQGKWTGRSRKTFCSGQLTHVEKLRCALAVEIEFSSASRDVNRSILAFEIFVSQ